MPDFFSGTQLGSVQVEGRQVRLSISGFGHNNLFITRLSGGVKPNFQLMYSLGADAFLNAFCQRMSLWELQGLHILTSCTESGETINTPNGSEPPFLTFYRQHNIVSSSRAVTMSFNNIVLSGFLIECSIDNYRQDGVEGYIFRLGYLARMRNLHDQASGGGLQFEAGGGSGGMRFSAGGGSGGMELGTHPVRSGQPTPPPVYVRPTNPDIPLRVVPL